jgi:hypothetical protein
VLVLKLSKAQRDHRKLRFENKPKLKRSATTMAEEAIPADDPISDHFDDISGETDAKTATAVLIQRVHHLEAQLTAAQSEVAQTRRAATEAQCAQEVAEHQAAQTGLDRAALETDMMARHAEEVHRLQREHAVHNASLAQTAKRLEEKLDEEVQKNTRLMHALQNEGRAHQATRELAAHVNDLERRNAVLRKAVEAERARGDELQGRAKHEEALVHRCAAAERQVEEVGVANQALSAELAGVRSKLEVAKEVSAFHKDALHQTVSLLREAGALDNSGITTSNSDMDAMGAVALVRGACSKFSALESVAKAASDGHDRLRQVLSDEIAEGKRLAGELTQARTDAEAAKVALETAEVQLRQVSADKVTARPVQICSTRSYSCIYYS